MLVHPQQDAVVVAHLVAGEWVTAGCTQGQHVSLGPLKQPPLQGYQGQGG